MASIIRPVLVICLVLIGLAIIAGGGGSGTVAYMSDTSISNNSIQTDESFNSGVQYKEPCIDENGNGVCESSEPTLNESQIVDFEDPTVDVVVPWKATVDSKSSVSITANTVTVHGEIRADPSVTLNSTGGELIVTDATVSAKKGDITLGSDGDMDLSETKLRTKKGGAATADLTTTSATLTVENAEIQDGDDDLVYSPSGVTVVGQTKKGSVTAA